MNLDDYSLLNDWRPVPRLPNLMVRADGAIKMKDPIRYGLASGVEYAQAMFSVAELDRMALMVHGNSNAWRK